MIVWEFHDFHEILRNWRNPSPRPTGRRKHAQTMETLRNYIGSGEANPLRDHQSQPRSSQNPNFRTLDGFLVEFQQK